MTLIYLLILAAIFLVPFVAIVFAPEDKAIKREVRIQNGVAKLPETQLILIPLTLIMGSLFMVAYKGHTSSEKSFESYVSYSKAYCDRFCDEESNKNLAALIPKLNSLERSEAIRELHAITDVPYFGQSELFLSVINYINTPIILAFLSILFFILSGFAISYNSKIVDEQAAVTKLLTYNIFSEKKFWAILITFFIVLEVLMFLYITSIALYLVLVLLSGYLFAMTVLYKYNKECTQASEILFGICFASGLIVLSIYGIDFYNDYKYTIEIGEQIISYKVQHYQQLFAVLQQEWNNIQANNVTLTPDMLHKYSCVTKGSVSMVSCLNEFIAAERQNNLASFISQIVITFALFLIETFAMLWSARTGKMQNLTKYAISSTLKEDEVLKEDIKDNGKIDQSNSKVTTYDARKNEIIPPAKDTNIVLSIVDDPDDKKEEEEDISFTIGNSI